MSSQKNDNRKPLDFVSAISEFIGVMAGMSVLTGKWIGDQVGSVFGEKTSQPKQAAKTPVQIDSERRIAAIEEKITGQKQVKTKKKAVKKKKTVKKTTKKRQVKE